MVRSSPSAGATSTRSPTTIRRFVGSSGTEPVERGDDGYRLRDVGSLNGTYVNHKRVDEARLRHHDEVQIGRYRLSFVLGGEHGERDA